jgi:hypothetical protein
MDPLRFTATYRGRKISATAAEIVIYAANHGSVVVFREGRRPMCYTVGALADPTAESCIPVVLVHDGTHIVTVARRVAVPADAGIVYVGSLQAGGGSESKMVPKDHVGCAEKTGPSARQSVIPLSSAKAGPTSAVTSAPARTDEEMFAVTKFSKDLSAALRGKRPFVVFPQQPAISSLEDWNAQPYTIRRAQVTTVDSTEASEPIPSRRRACKRETPAVMKTDKETSGGGEAGVEDASAGTQSGVRRQPQ